MDPSPKRTQRAKKGDTQPTEVDVVRFVDIGDLFLPRKYADLLSQFTVLYQSLLFMVRAKAVMSINVMMRAVQANIGDLPPITSDTIGQMLTIYPGFVKFSLFKSVDATNGSEMSFVKVDVVDDDEVVDIFSRSKKRPRGYVYTDRAEKFKDLLLRHLSEHYHSKFLQSINAPDTSEAYLRREKNWHPGFLFFLKMDQVPPIEVSEYLGCHEVGELQPQAGSSFTTAAAPLDNNQPAVPSTQSVASAAPAAAVSDDTENSGGFIVETPAVTVDTFVEYLKTLDFYEGQIVHDHWVEGREPMYADSFPAELHPLLKRTLLRVGIERLYTHQFQGLEHVFQGKNVAVSTSTASGKSLIFHLPVIQSVLANPESRAFYIFPTRALAQDQLKWVRNFVESLERTAVKDNGEAEVIPAVRACAFDSDTAFAQRAAVRDSSQIIMTNPDMLHYGILRQHSGWQRVLANLKYIVLDEAHYYRGVFGCHVALILRRLLRLCQRVHKSSPQVIICSATMASPLRHAHILTGLDFEAVDVDGSPRAPKRFIFWDEVVSKDPADASRRPSSAIVQGVAPPVGADVSIRGPIMQIAFILSHLVRYHINTIAFYGSRRLAELSLRICRDYLTSAGLKHLTNKVDVYRAGYVRDMRREVEAQLFSGELWAVCATNALELGIDIGEAQVTMCLGFPGSVASFWQQAGRAGRRMQKADGTSTGCSLCFFIPFPDPMNQHILRNPNTILDLQGALQREQTPLSATNSYIVKLHAPYAQKELAIEANSDPSNPDAVFEAALTAKVDLKKQKQFSIRNIDDTTYKVIDAASQQLIETADTFDAICRLFPGAVYISRGLVYTVSKFDAEDHSIYVTTISAVSYITEPMDHTHCQATRILQRVHYNGFSVVLADMHVRRFVKYYIKRDIKTELILDHVRVELPEVHYDTRGIYYEFDGSLFPTLTTGTDRNANVLPAFQVVHAAEHTILGLVPLHTSCARSDIMGQGCDVSIFDNIRPTISIFETTAGGSGISEILLEKAVDLLRNAAEAVEVCPCEQGCAMCVCSIACAIHNEELNKAGCAAFLRHIVNLNTIPSPQAAQTAPLS